VTALELAEGHVEPHRPQFRYDDAAALIDRQNLIRGPVRDEEARTAVGLGADDEPRRERGNARKEIAVGEAERNRVGRAVGEAADGDARGIDIQPAEYVLERAIQKRDIVAKAFTNGIPGRAARVRREYRDARPIGRRSDTAQHARAVLGRTVQEHEQRYLAGGRR
jgi:hypothetical protein